MKRPVRLPMASVTEDLDRAMRQLARREEISLSEAICRACDVWVRLHGDARATPKSDSLLIQSSSLLNACRTTSTVASN